MDSKWLLSWGIGSVALGGASLLVPLYVVALGGGAIALGALAALAAFGGVPGALVAGRIADRTGKRRVFVVVPLAIVALVLLVMPAVSSLVAVVLINAVVWLAFAAAAPALNLLAVAGAEEHEWSGRLASLNAYQGYGWAGGLVLGLVWTAAGVRLVGQMTALRSFFLACGVLAGLGAIAATRWLPPESTVDSTLRTSRHRELARAMRRASRTGIRGATFPVYPGRLYWSLRNFRLGRFAERFSHSLATYYVAVLLFFAGFAAFFAPLPLFLSEAGFNDGEVFGMYLVSSLGAAVFFTAAGRLAARYDLTLVHAGGLFFRGAALPAVALIASAATLVGALVTGAVFFFIGISWAVIAVTAATLITRLAPVDVRGEALGVYAAIAALAGGLGSVLGGWFASLSYVLAFGAAGALVTAAGVLVVVLRQRTIQQASEDASVPS
jgi:predicted MFS family arabinose efflux permease